MEEKIITPYVGMKILVNQKTLEVNLIELCNRWDEINPTASVEEEQIIDLVVLTLLDYEGDINNVCFTGKCILHTIFEFNTMIDILNGLACRKIRPTSISISLDNNLLNDNSINSNPQERFKKIVEFNRYLTVWTLDCSTGEISRLMSNILNPFLTAKHIKHLKIVSSDDSSKDNKNTENNNGDLSTTIIYADMLTKLVESGINFEHVSVNVDIKLN